ncbi:MAG: C-terminal binding protein [Clostridiales bacterium]|nr:C-terminal binding protein [Clostridiales bacterium]
MKILVINNEGGNIDIEKKVILDNVKNCALEVKYVNSTDVKATRKEVIDADAVIAVNVDFDRETLETMEKCKIIATQTIGFDTIDIKAATELGIAVTNNPSYCVEEVAAHTVALALACNRNLSVYNQITRKKIWNADEVYTYGEMHRISESTLGVVGLGNIGKRVIKIMQAMGMKAIGYDPFVEAEEFEKIGVKKVDTLEEIFSQSDIITLHTPLNEKTKNMVSMPLLKLMKKTAVLINAARGGIVNETDLYKALSEEMFAGLGTDVINDEKTFETPLYELERALITPHIAYYTEEALDECRRVSAEQVVQVIEDNKKPEHLVNKDVKI